MIRAFAAGLVLAGLAACGADGPPESPAKTSYSALTIAGEAAAGIARNGSN